MDPILLLTGLVVLAGALVQAMSGFGFGMVCMSLLPLFMPVDQAVPMVAAWGLALNLVLVWRLRRHVSLRRAGPLLAGGLLGIPLGVLFLNGADPRLIRGVLGAVIVGYCLQALLLRRKPVVDGAGPSPLLGGLAGLIGGALGGAFNTSGPPAVLYVTAMGWAKDAATSTVQTFFLFSTSMTIIGHVSVGLLTPELFWRLLPVYPAVLLGSYVGAHIYDRVPQERFRVLVLGLLLVLGANFLVRAALGV